MAKAADVAAYVLKRQMSLDTYKLHKLLHYAQGWHLAWYAAPLFTGRLEAWVHGPVCVDVWPATRGAFNVSHIPGARWEGLTQQERDTVDEVMRVYGAFSGKELELLTHMEPAWLDARGGRPDHERSNAEITHAALLRNFLPLAELGPAGEIPAGVTLGLAAWHADQVTLNTGEGVPTTAEDVAAFLRGDRATWHSA